jgi:hypothetical protein
VLVPLAGVGVQVPLRTLIEPSISGISGRMIPGNGGARYRVGTSTGHIGDRD